MHVSDSCLYFTNLTTCVATTYISYYIDGTFVTDSVWLSDIKYAKTGHDHVHIILNSLSLVVMSYNNLLLLLLLLLLIIIIIIMALQPIVRPWPRFQFLDPIHSR
jgi:hypothetical protein